MARLEPTDLRAFTPRSWPRGSARLRSHHLHALLHVALQRAVDDGLLGATSPPSSGRSNRPEGSARRDDDDRRW